jgi:hypothetical protein
MLLDKFELTRTSPQLNIGANCKGCGGNTHDVDTCPMIHLAVDTINLAQKFMQNYTQNRSIIIRR